MLSILPPSQLDLVYATPTLAVGTVNSTEGIMRNTKRNAVAVYSQGVESFLWMLREQCSAPKGNMSSSKYEADFNTYSSYEEAMEVFSKRPYELLNYKENKERLLSSDNAGIEIVADVYGDALSMERVIRGEPDVYDRFIWGNPLGVFADLTFVGTTMGGIEPEVMDHRMQRIVRLVDWLESSNVRTAVRGLWLNSTAAFELEVKQYDQNLDLATLAVAAHPDFLRRMVFRLREYSKTYETGYGQSTTASSLHKDIEFETSIATTIDYFHSIPAIDKAFDKAEVEIAQGLEDGERAMKLMISGG